MLYGTVTLGSKTMVYVGYYRSVTYGDRPTQSLMDIRAVAVFVKGAMITASAISS